MPAWHRVPWGNGWAVQNHAYRDRSTRELHYPKWPCGCHEARCISTTRSAYPQYFVRQGLPIFLLGVPVAKWLPWGHEITGNHRKRRGKQHLFWTLRIPIASGLDNTLNICSSDFTHWLKTVMGSSDQACLFHRSCLEG